MSPIADSIEHWKRMIAWAELQSPMSRPIPTYMCNELGECWGGADCALCKTHNGGNGCLTCPLQLKGYGCGYVGSPHDCVVDAGSWGEWVVAARRMLSVLEGLS